MVVVYGALFAFAFAPFSIWVAAPIAYFLLIRALSRTSRPVLISFLFGLSAHLLILSWAKNYVGVPPYFALALLQALFSLPLGLHFRFHFPLHWVPATFLAAEFLRSFIPFGGFGWTNPGFTQNDSPFANLAPLGGVFLIAVSVFALTLVRNRYQLSLVLLLFLAGLIYHPEKAEESLNVAAVQGGVVPRSSNYYQDIRKVFQRHFTLTQKTTSVDLTLWPEDIVDGNPNDREFSPYFKELKGRELIIGASPMVEGAPENQSIHIGANGSIASRYSKMALVPFGEYVPFRSIVDKLNSHVDDVIDYRPGTSFIVHRVKGKNVASLICFEIVDDQRVRRAAQAASIVITQTNSATFIGTAQSQQQFDIARTRAREYSRFVAGVSTVGITGFIDNHGTVIAKLKQNRPGVLYGQIESQESQTPYALFPYLSVIFVLFFGLTGRPRSAKRWGL